MYSNDDQSATEKYFNEELKKKGVQTEFVAYPDEVHGFSVRFVVYLFFVDYFEGRY